MKKKVPWMFLIYGILAFLLLRNMSSKEPQQVITGDPQAEFQKIVAQEEAAGEDKDLLKNVKKEYNSFEKKYAKTFPKEGARARFHIGIIEETKIKKESIAVKTYQSIIRKYSNKAPDVVAETQKRLTDLEQRLDKKNSSQLGYKIIDWLVGITGRNSKFSYAFALLIITLVIKLLTTPLTHIQMKSMKEMQKIQPLIKQLQELILDQKG